MSDHFFAAPLLCARLLIWALFYFVLQGADSRDGDFDGVAGMEEAGRIEADADTARRARCDDVAREKGRPLGNGVDQFGDGEDEFARRTVLADFAVDLGDDIKGFRGSITQENVGAHGAEGVEALAVEPLAVIGLEVPGRYVVQNRKAVDVIHGFADGDVRPFFADDDGQFPFVVDLFGYVLMGLDGIVRADDGRRGLGEDDRVLRFVGKAVLSNSAMWSA